MPDLEPMLAVTGTLPPPDQAGWAYEIKWDGMRALVAADSGALRVRSRRRAGLAPAFPELDELPRSLGADALLDGELVAFDTAGRPTFSAMSERMHVADRRTASMRAADNPVTYVVFDVLHVAGMDCWTLPFEQRRRLLVDLVEPGPYWRVVDQHLGAGGDLLDAAAAQGLEGIMAKRLDRAYEPGRRSTAWRKVKLRHEAEFVVAGWLPGRGGRAGRVGSLMLGAHDRQGRLRWVGNVGTGLTDAALAEWTDRLTMDSSPDCPFDPPPAGPAARGARWVRPRFVVQVAFAEWTPDGRLRHPSVLGERDDKAADEVTLAP